MPPVIYVELEAVGGVLHIVNPAHVTEIVPNAGGKGCWLYRVSDDQPLRLREAAREVANKLEKAFLTPPGTHHEQTEERH